MLKTRRSDWKAETHASFGDVVVVVHDVPGQTEVADLYYLALGEQDVPGSQVAVDALQGKRKKPKSVTAPAAPKRLCPNTVSHPFIQPSDQPPACQVPTASISAPHFFFF